MPTAARFALTRERAVLLSVLVLGAIGCLLGLLSEPAADHHSSREQVLDLVRVLCTVAMVVALLLGPGVAMRALNRERQPGFALLFLPGLAILILTGLLAWALAGSVAPRDTCLAVAVPVLGAILVILLGADPADL